MKKFAHLDGRLFMIVRPVKTLFQSSMIHDVVSKGRVFAVDMNSGELTVLDPERFEEKIKTTVKKQAVKSTQEKEESLKMFFHSPANVKKALSSDLDTAIVQIQDQNDLSTHYGVKGGGGTVTFLKDDSANMVIWRSGESCMSFLERVRKAYRALS